MTRLPMVISRALLAGTIFMFLTSALLIALGQRDRRVFEAGTSALRERNYNLAVDSFTKFLVRRPNERMAWFRLGIALYYTGDAEGAVRALEEAQRCPGEPDAEYVDKTLRYAQAIADGKTPEEPLPSPLRAFGPR